jgi:hypothetical protein
MYIKGQSGQGTKYIVFFQKTFSEKTNETDILFFIKKMKQNWVNLLRMVEERLS